MNILKLKVNARTREFIQVIQFIKPRLWSYFTGLIIFCCTEVSFYISIPIAVKTMIDAALKKDMALLWQGIYFILTVSICGGISFVIFMYLFIITVAKVTAGLRTRVFDHTLNLPAPYFEQNHSGDILSRITNDINTLKNSYDWPLWSLLVTLVSGTGAAVVMLILDWRVSLFLLLTSVTFTVLNMKFAAVIGKISKEIQEEIGKLTESMGNVLGGFAVIKRFHLEKKMQDQFEVHNRAILAYSQVRIKKTAWLDSYNFLISWINFGGILALGAILAGKGLMEFGTMVAMVNLLWNVNRMIRETGGYIAQFQGYLAGATRVIELNEKPEEPEQPAQNRMMAGEDQEVIVEMQAISFSYDKDRKVLKDFNLKVKEGQTVALVGPSGAGKSTVIKLMLGFYLPAEGSIKISRRRLKDLSFHELRAMMAYVPQDAFIFDGTIAENIAYGNPEAGMAEIVQAAKAAYAHEFIHNTEQGYDTQVGERGTKLSGGQRQRIAIARAFLKNAPILLLDEATSSLDSQSEQLIQDALRELGKDKTVIVIAHRLSTIEDADVIYVIDEGRVVEQGRHEELLGNEGLYKRLYEAQYKLDDNANVS
ncbi:MAG TPA: ABC transporter ATP-binding protein [Bacillota bacterium]|nr:ABC transporter ATP-binding protein [Bacillota bacterium]